MSVLSRRVGEEIVIADDIRVMVVAFSGQTIRLGITRVTRDGARNALARSFPFAGAAPAANALFR